MSTTETPEHHDGQPLLGLGSSEQLGAVSEARCYVHVHAPQPDAFGISRQHCPTCQRRTYMLWRHTPWYGSDDTCLPNSKRLNVAVKPQPKAVGP